MRLRSIVAILVAILIGPFLAFWAWSAVEARRLDRALDALEARNEPLDLDAFDPKPTTDEQRQASHFYKQATTLVADLRPRWLAETGKIIEEFCTSADPATHQGRETSLRSFEDGYKRALELLDRATALDARGWDTADKPARMSIAANLPYELAGVNAVRVARLACSGNGDAAGTALLASLRLRRVLSQPAPRLAIRTGHSLQLVLSAGASPTVLSRIQREYEQIAAEPGVESTLKAARAQFLFFAEPGLVSDPPPGSTARRLTPFAAVGLRLLRPARDHTVVSELREFEGAIQAASQPWPRALDATRDFENRYRRRSARPGPIAAVSAPFGRHVASSMVESYVRSAAEALARTRASIAALAVARWRAEHGGAFPASLHDLEPSYLSGRLMDPYTGEELKYVISGTGYKVYSVGVNRTDDGGAWEHTTDLQSSRRGNPLDIGIAVNQN